MIVTPDAIVIGGTNMPGISVPGVIVIGGQAKQPANTIFIKNDSNTNPASLWYVTALQKPFTEGLR